MTTKTATSRRKYSVSSLDVLRIMRSIERGEPIQYAPDGRRLLTTEEKIRALERLIKIIRNNAESSEIAVSAESGNPVKAQTLVKREPPVVHSVWLRKKRPVLRHVTTQRYAVGGRRLLTTKEKIETLERLIENIKENAAKSGITLDAKGD